MRPASSAPNPFGGEARKKTHRRQGRCLLTINQKPNSVSPAIVWFREDLRLADQPALAAASGRPLVLLYIREAPTGKQRALGGASHWWLDKSLRALGRDIAARGGQLTLRAGEAAAVLDDVIRETGAGSVFWNRRYDEGGRAVDEKIKQNLKARGLCVDSFNGRLLTEPWEVKTGSGAWYKVFTPYWRRVREVYAPPAALPPPSNLAGPSIASDDLDTWGLHPSRPDWSAGLDAAWSPGEHGAKKRLHAFLKGPVNAYAEARNRPDLGDSTSGLSPHLRFGEISPHLIWREVQAARAEGRINDRAAEVFLSEIVWREFSYVLLFHMADFHRANYNATFNAMPWIRDARSVRAWQKGMTGYPVVDAGMRQLWTTGWMHNRVRMIVASFLTKHLLIHWREGEDWFWDTLVDADPAANPASWQWTAGSGADAAPYFRIFNPITQGQKFDETGEYVRRWCPELSRLPLKFLHAPWTASAAVLKDAGVELGNTYPKPVIDHERARQRALDAYATLKAERVIS